MLLLPLLSYAQDCKFKKNEIDEFSKTKVVQTKRMAIVDIFSPTQSIQVELNYDKTITIAFDISVVNMKRLVFNQNEENSLLLLLNNDQVINFSIPQTITEKYSITALGGINQYRFNFPISLEDLKAIRNFQIKKIRFDNKDKPVTFEVSNKNKIEKFNTILDCFLSEIQK